MNARWIMRVVAGVAFATFGVGCVGFGINKCCCEKLRSCCCPGSSSTNPAASAAVVNPSTNVQTPPTAAGTLSPQVLPMVNSPGLDQGMRLNN